jgi:aryl-alcohol dehydrogenase-like predicted oxidoreductase
MDGENTKMGYTFLGKGTGLLVSELCFGLMTLSTDGALPPPNKAQQCAPPHQLMCC